MTTDNQLEIIIVDDDEGHSELIRRNLKRAGVSNAVVSLTSGSDAIDYVFGRGKYEQRPNQVSRLMLLDIKMPGPVDGVEVLRTIKSDPQKKNMPVIMLTTTDDPREIARCYDLGCNIYVTKPVEPRKFIEAIGHLGLFIAIVNVPSCEP